MARWDAVHELADVVAGHFPGRASEDQITLFKSNGIAAEDIAVAGKVYELALAAGRGQKLPVWASSPAPARNRPS